MIDAPHVCTPETCPTRRYFVTALDAGATHYMAGPYPTHFAALADVAKALSIADKHDGRSWFMAWGTVRIKDDSYRPEMLGTLNKAGLL
jgi:L-alanine-DL-glutamate epimerase-like enolase superfamily enzyme